MAIEETIRFSHMTFLMSYVTCLNNTLGQSYNLSFNGLEKIASNMFGDKLCPYPLQKPKVKAKPTNKNLF